MASTAKLGQGVGLGHEPGRHVRYPGVEDFALTHQVVEGPHDFFDGRDLVPNVQPIEVDVVGLEPFQTGLQRLHHALAMVAGGVRVIAGHGVGILGRQHEPLPLALHELAQQPFARSVGIDVGRVDEVAARLKEGVIDLAAFFRRKLPIPNLRRMSWCPGTVPRLEGRCGPIICIASYTPRIGWIVAKPAL